MLLMRAIDKEAIEDQIKLIKVSHSTKLIKTSLGVGPQVTEGCS